MLVAIRICPLTAVKKTSWPSQSVTGFAGRRTCTLPRTKYEGGGPCGSFRAGVHRASLVRSLG